MTYEKDDLDRQLVLLAHDDSVPSDLLRARTLNASLTALEPPVSQYGSQSALSDSSPPIARLVPDVPSDSADEARRRTHLTTEDQTWRHTTRRLVMLSRKRYVRYGVIAAGVAIIMLGGVRFWSGDSQELGSNSKWWLGPPAAVAEQINAAMDKAGGEAVTCWEQHYRMTKDGLKPLGDTSIKLYRGRDSYRRDIYDLDFLREIQEQDLVIGSRYISGVNVINWPMTRLLLSYYANVYSRIITGMPVRDATGGFKCFRRQVLESIDLDSVHSTGYSFQIEMNMRVWKKASG